ncbi:F0F1 ATP synthase subunit A [Desulfurobacterium atlanticum]|uniref:ATP synthase subunit a n=1 Tax=Desulfurobacterium atlanticum TaxID=240169 RepID=A0A238ZST7_9BACT|nr:F0F1 ATP synthase subunit A [Desulfurobacterium atlanticum]SNR86071.1 ATP synthase F0 subcomplex A subunit [Desulfurobacterium atlanticum]
MEHGGASGFITWPVVYWTWITMAFVIFISYLVSRNLKKIPGKLQYLFEAFVGFIAGVLADALGEEKGLSFLSLVGGLAFFILSLNLVGLVPGAIQPTSNLNTTVGLALISFFAYNIVAVKEQGLLNYLKHFLGPVKALAPLMLPIEIVSHLSRILSLSLRLFGNMFGDEMIVWVLLKMVPLLVPVFGLAIVFGNSFLQTYIFCMLTVVYLSLAVHHEEEEEH